MNMVLLSWQDSPYIRCHRWSLLLDELNGLAPWITSMYLTGDTQDRHSFSLGSLHSHSRVIAKSCCASCHSRWPHSTKRPQRKREIPRVLVILQRCQFAYNTTALWLTPRDIVRMTGRRRRRRWEAACLRTRGLPTCLLDSAQRRTRTRSEWIWKMKFLQRHLKRRVQPLTPSPAPRRRLWWRPNQIRLTASVVQVHDFYTPRELGPVCPCAFQLTGQRAVQQYQLIMLLYAFSPLCVSWPCLFSLERCSVNGRHFCIFIS